MHRLQVGRSGSTVGIDIKNAAVALSRQSVQGLVCADPDFARQAALPRFHAHNVFMPSLRHKASKQTLGLLFFNDQDHMLE